MEMQSFDLVEIAGKTTLYLDSNNIEGCLNYYRTHQVDCLAINYIRGYKFDTLDFLKEHSYITDLAIMSPLEFQFDQSPIRELHDLRSLVISDELTLDLGEFPKLEEFHGHWHEKIRISECANLKILDLGKYNPKSKDLTTLPNFPSLVELGLTQSNLTSLRGISRLPGLKQLDLAYMSKLELLCELDQLHHLERLYFNKCPKLKNHESVRELKGLRELRFNSCGEIEDIKFLHDMPSLEEFRFVDTNIVDGDLRPLLRLKRVGFLRKKHYSHTPDDVANIIEDRVGSA